MSCSECKSPVEHEPEECPTAVWYGNGGLGACEAYWLTTPDGRAEMIGLIWGTEEYEHAVIEGTEVMHIVGGCRI
jgi:hypothetical protein